MSTSTLDEIEEEAKAAAEKMVMNMMQRPGQLEKVCAHAILSNISTPYVGNHSKHS